MTDAPPPPAPDYSSQPSQPATAQPNPYASASPYAAAPQQKTNVLAIVSLVLAFFISIGAIICGHIALNQIKRTGENGRGLAIAGLVLGYLGLVGGLILSIVWISFFTLAASNGVTFAP